MHVLIWEIGLDPLDFFSGNFKGLSPPPSVGLSRDPAFAQTGRGFSGSPVSV